MGCEVKDYKTGGSHTQHAQVSVYHMPGRVNAHLFQPMDTHSVWVFVPWKPHTFVNRYYNIDNGFMGIIFYLEIVDWKNTTTYLK